MILCSVCNQPIQGTATGRIVNGRVQYFCKLHRHSLGFIEASYRPDPLSRNAPAYIPFKALDRSIGRMGRPLGRDGKPRKDKSPSNVD